MTTPETPALPLLVLDQLAISYEHDTVIKEFDLSIHQGDICCLLGPSGCGKTTVLRAIAGFQPIDQGQILLSGSIISTPINTTAPEHRQVGMVFQDYALFPHLSVRENIGYGIPSKARLEKDQICEELLALVKLEDKSENYPHELSGGQQQRIALARALAPSPSILLMDEPFSSLDVDLRRELAIEIRDILKSRGITAIMVTHDQEEAFAFADHIGIVNQGRLEQWATPFELYHQPQSRFVANFVGHGSFIPGTIINSTSAVTELGLIEGSRHYPWPADTNVEILLRPDDIIQSDDGVVSGEVTDKVFAGAATLYNLCLPKGGKVKAAFPSHLDFEVGDKVNLELTAEHLIAFNTE